MEVNSERLTSGQLKTLVGLTPDFVNLKVSTGSDADEIKSSATNSLSYAQANSEFLELLQQLIHDENVPLFFDRHAYFSGSIWIRNNGMHHYYVRVAELAWNAYLKQKAEPLDISIRPSTPHGLSSYITVRTLEQTGCSVLTIGRSGISGYWKLFKGIGRDRKPVKLNYLDEASQHAYVDSVSTFVSNVQSTYENAIPDYEKRRLDRNKNRIFYLPTIVKQNLKRPSWVVNSYLSWRAMKQLSTNHEAWVGKKHIIFFLQYQPERTSLPEAYGFTVQINALLALRSCAPADVNILVKEHPSSFTNLCHPLYRTASFYRKIAAIPGIDIVEPETDTFALIDSALCVATLTGTVGLEALIRGKPAIFFGLSMIEGVTGQHVYTSPEKLVEFIGQASEAKFPPENVVQSVKQALYDDADYTFRSDEPEAFSTNLATLYTLLKNLFENGDALRSLAAD